MVMKKEEEEVRRFEDKYKNKKKLRLLKILRTTSFGTLKWKMGGRRPIKTMPFDKVAQRRREQLVVGSKKNVELTSLEAASLTGI